MAAEGTLVNTAIYVVIPVLGTTIGVLAGAVAYLYRQLRKDMKDRFAYELKSDQRYSKLCEEIQDLREDHRKEMRAVQERAAEVVAVSQKELNELNEGHRKELRSVYREANKEVQSIMDKMSTLNERVLQITNDDAIIVELVQEIRSFKKSYNDLIIQLAKMNFFEADLGEDDE